MPWLQRGVFVWNTENEALLLEKTNSRFFLLCDRETGIVSEMSKGFFMKDIIDIFVYDTEYTSLPDL